jgi:hypothetical protein
MTVQELFQAATGRDELLAEFATVVAEAVDGVVRARKFRFE